MKFEWGTIKCKDFIEFNQAVPLKKGKVARKIPMEILNPYCKYTQSNLFEEYKGGAKFINNDTIMARITPCLENGKTAFIDCLDEDEAAFGSTEFTVLRAIKDVSDPQFIYYLTIYEPFKNAAVSSMTGSSGRQRVQLDALKEYEINVPDLATQQKIGHILSLFDEKIRINSQINDNLEKQGQEIYRNFFIDHYKPEWKMGILADIGTIVGGGTPSKAHPEYYCLNGIGWITPKDLSLRKDLFIAHGENDISELGLQKSTATIMPKGTILFSSRAPIGYIAIASDEVCTNQGFKSIIPNKNIGTPFVYYFIKNNVDTIEGMASGSTFKEVSGNTMKNIPIFIPDNNIIYKFNMICESLFSKRKYLENENKKLSKIRELLLPKLMSGELDVSEIAI